MPIFEYTCNTCNHEFEALVFGRDKAACPKCQGKKLTPKLSVFAMAGSGKSSSDLGSGMGGDIGNETGGCGSCGDPRGPGSCSMDDLD